MSLKQVSFLFNTGVKSHIKLAQVKAPGPLSCATWLSGNFLNVRAPPIYLCLSKPAPEPLLPVSQYEYSLNPAIRPVKTPLNPLNFPHSLGRSSYRKGSPASLCVTWITGRCYGHKIKSIAKNTHRNTESEICPCQTMLSACSAPKQVL